MFGKSGLTTGLCGHATGGLGHGVAPVEHVGKRQERLVDAPGMTLVLFIGRPSSARGVVAVRYAVI